MNRTTMQRRAYTFTEILVVTAIVGILVALLLPAVQAAREASRRLNCSKNLEQLIIAVHNYENLHRVYPPGTVNDVGPIQSLPNGYHHNWLIQILPFIEQKNAYAHIDDLVGVYHENNVQVRALNLQSFRCPSAPVPPFGYSDYAGVHNDIESPIDVTNNGTFFLNSRLSYFDLKDGSSNTLFIGEKNTYQGDLGWMSGTRATLRNTGVAINASSGGWRNRNSRRPYPANYPPAMAGDHWQSDDPLSDEPALDSLFGANVNAAGADGGLHEWTVVDQRLIVSEESNNFGGEDGYWEEPMYASTGGAEVGIVPVPVPTDVTLAVGGFGSQHPGGSQFAVGDGSVRFLSETIDPQVYLQYGHRNDGRMVDGDW